MKLIYCFLLAGLISFCFSCQPTTNADSTKTAAASSVVVKDGAVSKEQFVKLLASDSNPQLIDVRTAEEFAEGAIDGAINYDFYQEDFSNRFMDLDKSRPVYIYCKSGGRSGKAYQILKDMGFEQVYDLGVGYSGWK